MGKNNGPFTWEDTIDSEIEEKGTVFMSGCGRSQAIQRFAEDLSNLVQYKCDWSFAAGRFYMRVLPEGIPAVKAALANEDWLRRYRVDYSEESWTNGTYFEYTLLPCVISGPEECKEVYQAEEAPVIEKEEIKNEVKKYITRYSKDGVKVREYIGSDYI